MSDKAKIFLSDARRFADEICKILEPACERIEVAGSIRRMSAMVGDIEIVCQPKLTIDGPDSLSAIDTLVEQLIPDRQGKLAFDTGEGMPDSGLRWNTKHSANGSRYKRLVWVGRWLSLVPFGYAGMAMLVLIATDSPSVIAIGTCVLAPITGAWFIIVAARFISDQINARNAERPPERP